MSETKVPPFQVKHIDGVMHLTLPTQTEAKNSPEKLRVQPPSTLDAE